MMTVTTMHRQPAILASLLWMKVATAPFLLADSSTTGSSQRRTHTSEYFSPPHVRGGAVLYMAIGETSPSVGGSVAVTYQAIGTTLHKR